MEDAMTFTWRRRAIPTGLLTLLLGLGLTDLAAADGGGGGGGGDERAGMQQTRPTPEDPDYSAAVRAIKAERFADAIPLLEKVVAKEPRNADAYNWLGYATRRKGDPAASIPIYQKALAIDPKHKGVHEYIGEAYLMLGNLPKAKEHLATLDKLCFFSCEEYRDLKKAVERFEKTGKVSTTH
jgi:tetratricopeptide (TPR) repeat protein